MQPSGADGGLSPAQADALIMLSAHLGEGVYALNSLDPSVTDEGDPLSCDPGLDMYNPDNGYRQPPGPSRYTAGFLARYRKAQRARCMRLDAMARDDIQRRREAREAMSAPGFPGLPQARRATERRAQVSRYLTVARTDANPASTGRDGVGGHPLVIFPGQAQDIIDHAGTTDTSLVAIDADHYGRPASGTVEDVIQQAGDAITSWLATHT